MKKALFILLSIISFHSLSQVEVDLSNPNATIYTHLYFLQDDSYQPEKAATTIYGKTGEEAKDKAIKLKKILDGRGLKVDFTQISKNPNYSDTSATFENTNKFTPFPIRFPEISVRKVNDKWYYSEETVAKIDLLYETTFAWSMGGLATWLPDSIAHKKLLKVEIWQYLGFIIILGLAFVLFLILKRIILFILRRLQKGLLHLSGLKIDNALKKLTRPITLLIIIALIRKVLPSLQLHLDSNEFLFLALTIFSTIFWIYVFLKLVHVVMTIYADRADKTENRLDDQLVPILNNFLTFVVVTIGIFRLMPIFGIDVKTVIMGASIGGLAIALASQDTVKNLIGTLMIFLDKPFHIGDWIEADGVEGTVEEVRFRSSRIRAADTSIYQIPNSKLSEITINNKGVRLFRRYTTNLGVRYDTPPELLDTFSKGLEQIILANPNINNDNFKVAFIEFGDSSLKIMVNVYFEVLDWGPVQTAKHQFHLAIMYLAKELNVEFAFPSTTLYMENVDPKDNPVLSYNIDPDYMNSSVQKIVGGLKMDNLKANNPEADKKEKDD